MTSEINLVPEIDTIETAPLQANRSSLLTETIARGTRETIVLSTRPEKLLPAPPKEFPISKWNMPPEPVGYMKVNDNDCL